MVITAYDGRNINIVMDALQAKMLVALLDQSTLHGEAKAAQLVNKDGFMYEFGDIQAVSNQFKMSLKRITNTISNTGNNCTVCGMEKSKDNEDGTETPTTHKVQ